jgi:hypothetical protein
MTHHDMCQCVIDSMLSITATAWGQAPVDFSVANDEDRVPLRPSDRPVQLSSSVFEVRPCGFHLGCHALQGPRCNARVGESPSE